MAVYNGEKYLRPAVDSILMQDYRDFEFIIVDDGSTDATPEILNDYQDSRIVRVTNEKNRGLVYSLNRGCAAASAKYIVRMDADDLSVPDRISQLVEFMEYHPEVGVCGSWMHQFCDEGGAEDELRVPTSHKAIVWEMIFGTSIFHATVIMRREVLEACGGYREEYRHIEDTDLWTRLLGHTRFANIPVPLFKRRWHGESICNQYAQHQIDRMAEMKVRVFQHVNGTLPDAGLVGRFSNAWIYRQPLRLKDIVRIMLLLCRTATHNRVAMNDRYFVVELIRKLVRVVRLSSPLLSLENFVKQLISGRPAR